MDNSSAIINQLRSQTLPLRWVQLALDAQCNRKLWKLVSGSQTRHFSRQKSITATRHSHTKKPVRAIFNEYLSPVSYILGCVKKKNPQKYITKLALLPNPTRNFFKPPSPPPPVWFKPLSLFARISCNNKYSNYWYHTYDMTQTYNQVYVLSFQSHKRFTNTNSPQKSR